MKNEVWRAIPSFPEYQASSHGRIKRLPYTDVRGIHRDCLILKPSIENQTHRILTKGGRSFKVERPTPYNRLKVELRKGGKRKTEKVARLVCEAFHGKPPAPSMVCMHLDDDPLNNVPHNLRWGTVRDNNNGLSFQARRKAQK